MKVHLAVLILILAQLVIGGDLPAKLKFRVDQIKLLQAGRIVLANQWPEEASGLFQGINKEVAIQIESKEDHLAAIASIPKHLMKDRIIGETIESNGWFYTSIEHKDWKAKEASWFSVIASKKDSRILRFSYTW